jgi:hypothetical protein
MRVHVDKTRSDDQTGGVKDFKVIGNGIVVLAEPNDATVFNQKISAGIHLLRRIDHVTVLN